MSDNVATYTMSYRERQDRSENPREKSSKEERRRRSDSNDENARSESEQAFILFNIDGFDMNTEVSPMQLADRLRRMKGIRADELVHVDNLKTTRSGMIGEIQVFYVRAFGNTCDTISNLIFSDKYTEKINEVNRRRFGDNVMKYYQFVADIDNTSLAVCAYMLAFGEAFRMIAKDVSIGRSEVKGLWNRKNRSITFKDSLAAEYGEFADEGFKRLNKSGKRHIALLATKFGYPNRWEQDEP